MKEIALITNFNVFEKATAAMQVTGALAGYGATVLISESYKERIFRMRESRSEYQYLPAEELYRRAEILIVLGGDGTLLDAARSAAPLGKPVLGLNMGHLGYMTELELSELPLLERLFTGDYEIDERAMLSVQVRASGKGVRAESFALNDAVISNGSVARIVDLELYEGGGLVSSYRADGLIVATPTGSTAYSLSAGGPIIDPHLPCLCVTPVCPHSLTARPVLFQDSAVLEIKNTCRREKMLYLTLDGKASYEIYRGDTVRVTRSPMKTRLIRLKKGGFYAKLQQKMNGNG